MDFREPTCCNGSLRSLRRTCVGVRFDYAPLLVHDSAQFALHGFECIVDDFFERLVGAVIHLHLIRNELVPRCHGYVDTAPIRISFLVSMIGLLDGHIAAVDVIAKFLESCRIIQNETVNLLRFFDTPI
jgi:hypothetical protein